MVIRINADGSEEFEGTPEEIAEYRKTITDNKSHHDNRDCPQLKKQIITDYGGRLSEDKMNISNAILMAFL